MKFNRFLKLCQISTLKLTLGLFLMFNSIFCYAQSDQKLIETQVNRMVSDWNTHEFKNMNVYTTEDIEWVNIVGMWWKGRSDVIKAHQFTFDKFFNGVPFTNKSMTVRFLSPDIAIVNLICHVGSLFPPDGIDRGTNRTPETDNLLSLVYVKKKGTWLLSLGQNTVIDERAAKSNPISGKN